ncbi:MAG: YitT family protein [Zoogloeaceae bacterium]|nr:YitT family protein [Rhodocyclaceae bacterium]MCP5234549.1 YitT family protein [Zoogloeaceae bacterium]
MTGLESPPRHTRFEDVVAIGIGSLQVSLGLTLFQAAGVLSGGTAGLAFLAHYAVGWPLGAVFFAINLPFYVLAWRGMGRAFTIKTFIAVATVSMLAELLPGWITVGSISPVFAAIAGGLLLGNGLLILIRHRASLGGIGVMAVVLQERRGWRAGHVQLAADAAIFTMALAIVPAIGVALSLLGSVALNMVISMNHRDGRYMGF